MSDEPNLIVGEITAYRAWDVIGSLTFPLLASVTHSGTVWHPNRWTYATCGGELHCHHCDDGRVPGERCSCGLYAARDREHLSKLSYAHESLTSGKPTVIGEVGFAGKIIPGRQGWRAERGRVKRLFVPFHHWRWVDPLAELYQVPVQLDNVLKATPTFRKEG